MIYTKDTKFLRQLYKNLKLKRSECLSASQSKRKCHRDFYRGLIKLIYINIKFLDKSGQLTPKREQTLKLHLQKAILNFEKFK